MFWELTLFGIGGYIFGRSEGLWWLGCVLGWYSRTAVVCWGGLVGRPATVEGIDCGISEISRID